MKTILITEGQLKQIIENTINEFIKNNKYVIYRKDNHKWTVADNVVAFYYYKFGTQYLGIDENEIAEIIGTTVDSLKMQALNFKRIDTGFEGLSDYSSTQKQVYVQFRNYSRYELFNIVKKILNLDDILSQKELERMGFAGRKLRRI